MTDRESSRGWPRDDGHGGCDDEAGVKEEVQLFARGSDDGHDEGGEDNGDGMPDGEGELDVRIGPRILSMAMNPNHSVWKDPDANEEEDGIPRLADDSSDDELVEAETRGRGGQQDFGAGY